MTIKEMINLEMEKITMDEMNFVEEIQNTLAACGITDGWGSCGEKVH